MLAQYNAPRFRIDARGRRLGTIPVGTITYLQDRRDPWIVECWHNREYHSRRSTTSSYTPTTRD